MGLPGQESGPLYLHPLNRTKGSTEGRGNELTQMVRTLENPHGDKAQPEIITAAIQGFEFQKTRIDAMPEPPRIG